MRKIFVIIVVAIPILLALVFVTNSVASNTFPLIITSTTQQEKIQQNIQQTYNSSLQYCQEKYQEGNFKDQMNYEECLEIVESWYVDSIKNSQP
ncbi:MAG: hypothetical protein GTN97_02155 [Nitrosopumilaceae archaeon]|nr:hypothetical protein [Nitrosopumilaceae archaeon]NIP09955.1 hypothetical protein [Nitrosopumilaceae archaeon]NIS94726.1 hypothetical protein [Nitrosopumilaceae archaeon]